MLFKLFSYYAVEENLRRSMTVARSLTALKDKNSGFSARFLKA
jgi:hypothetical protein